jgi:hypothetical protein
VLKSAYGEQSFLPFVHDCPGNYFTHSGYLL